MKRLYLDIESYSENSLKKCGVYRYSEQSEVLLFQWAWDDEDVAVWDMTKPGASLDLMQSTVIDRADEIIIHNANFERTVLGAHGLSLPIEKIRCSMVLALQHSLPGGLDMLCDVLRVPFDKAKDKDGKKLINLFCKPRPKNVKIRRATQETHPEEWARFIEYARLDIEAMREVYKRLPRWNDTASERELWLLDQQVNDYGVAADLDLAEAALRAFNRASVRLATEVSEMTGGAVGSTTQRDKLINYLESEHGLGVPDMTKDTVERLLRHQGLSGEVRALLENRQQASATTPAKYRAFLEATGSDGRLRGTLQFCGAARTGRDSGKLVQLQNLKRTPDEFTQVRQESAVAAFKADCEDIIFDDPIEIISFCIRGVLVPAAGCKFAAADLSNIEGRVLAWLAGEERELAAFRAYDRGAGPDLYKITAGRILGKAPELVTKDERQAIGKVSSLSCGFGGALGAFRRMGGERVESMSDETIVGIVQQWRAAHPATKSYWYALERAARSAIGEPGASFTVRSVTFDARYDAYDMLWLRIRLPSGRYLCYPRPEVSPQWCMTCDGEGTVNWGGKALPCHECGGSGERGGGRGTITYEGVDQYSHQWARLGTYYGRIVENIVQAVARDIFMAGFKRAMTAGYPVVLRVHDELVCEVPANDNYSGEHLAEIMATHVSWTTGLPLAAAGDDLLRYAKGD